MKTNSLAQEVPASSEHPSPVQRRWLERGLAQPGGKLPLFDEWGQRISERTVRACIDQGWAEPWFTNPLKPDWLVCKLTDAGRELVANP
ncbi:MAG: hypothetical protein WD711_00400 [Dongiaceae bacterium]